MAFCTGVMSIVRKFWNSVSTVLAAAITEITVITQKIKDLEADPTVEAIIAALGPTGSAVEGWINSALNEITGIATEVSGLAAALTAWLNGASTAMAMETGSPIVPLTKPAKDAMIFKLASMAAKHADIATGGADPSKTDSFYDSAIQLHILMTKQAAEVAAANAADNTDTTPE